MAGVRPLPKFGATASGRNGQRQLSGRALISGIDPLQLFRGAPRMRSSSLLNSLKEKP
jgi:hypothetical protein